MAFADILFNLFVGESFIPLIISVVANIFFVPFGFVGLKHFFNWIDRNFTKPGKGYVYVRQKMPNDRFRYFWMRPTGRMGIFKTITGEDIEKPVNTKKGFVAYDGSLPMVEFDENGNQIKFDSEFSRPGAGQEDSIKGQKAAYEAGKFMGGTEIFNELKMLMIVVLVVGILGTLVSGYFSYRASTYTPTVDTSAVAAEVVNLLQNPSYNMTAGVPAIGG
jgi:hypothetical protein